MKRRSVAAGRLPALQPPTPGARSVRSEGGARVPSSVSFDLGALSGRSEDAGDGLAMRTPGTFTPTAASATAGGLPGLFPRGRAAPKNAWTADPQELQRQRGRGQSSPRSITSSHANSVRLGTPAGGSRTGTPGRDVRRELRRAEVAAVPDAVMQCDCVDLRVWSPVTTDATVLRAIALAARRVSEGALAPERVPTTGNQLLALLSGAAEEAAAGAEGEEGEEAMVVDPCALAPSVGLRVLCVAGSSVTDFALERLASLAGACVEEVDVGRCGAVTDAGVRCIAMGCPRLRRLVLADLDIEGSCLAAVADRVGSTLKELDVSGCRRLQAWQLQRVACAAPALEALSLARLPQLSDAALQAACPRLRALRRLDLSEAHDVTDVGVLAVSQGCGLLEHLSLTRTTAPYRITDVSLLAIAQRCPFLANLSIAGCASVTDAGLSWLASGCTSLQSLAIGGCSKITDAGVRAVAEACPGITAMHMHRLSRVSDVGIRVLGQACKQLTKLVAPGLPLLSDGKARDFGLEGLQALAQACPHLRELVLNACLQVGDVAVAALAASCPRLHVLELAHCARVSSRGVRAVAAGCPQLRRVNLSGCALVTDGAVASLAASCTRLHFVALHGCARLTDGAVKALVLRLPRLRHLNVGGLPALSDVAIMAITDSACAPVLTSLDLSHCPRVSGTALSWLAERCVSLMHMQLTGCNVKRAAVRALRRGWPLAQLREDGDGALGLAPLPGAAQQHAMRSYVRVQGAAARIQAAWRGMTDRRAVSVLRAERARQVAATRIQTLWRGHYARVLVAARRVEVAEEADAALLLQRHVRGWLARLRVARLRAELLRQRRNAAASLLQTKWRAFTARRHAKALFRGLQAEFRAKTAAAAQGQRAVRQQRARMHACATRVQKRWRGVLGRRRAAARKVAAAVQWREVWDESQRRNVYYNSVTREMRYRRPRALLELLPPLPCSNCEGTSATTECRDCSEPFCDACWRAVHAGGRRRAHVFRALYDYYSRRIDYGEGEWPALWPTEIQQDEFSGWFPREHAGGALAQVGGGHWAQYSQGTGGTQLYHNRLSGRTSQQRPAGFDTPRAGALPEEEDAVRGWVRYTDPASGYPYYYNHTTGESTYDRPPDFATPRVGTTAAAAELAAQWEAYYAQMYAAAGYPAEGDAAVAAAADTDAAAAARQPAWERVLDTATGQVQYFDRATGATSHARPDAFVTPPASARESGGWVKYVDEERGVVFFHCPATGESVYERPAEYQTAR